MKRLVDNLTMWSAIVFVMALYLTSCNERYKEKCYNSSDFCSGYIVGQMITSVRQGFASGVKDQESEKKFADDMALGLETKKTK